MAALSEIIGDSAPIAALREQVRRVLERPSDGRRLPPILILGETGTGKGLLARAIHRAGPRARAHLVEQERRVNPLSGSGNTGRTRAST